MRIHIKTTPNKVAVPFNYQQNLVGAFHKWLGKNEIHDETSLYCLSWLRNGRFQKEGLHFPQGAEWFVSVYEEALAKKLIKGILASPEIAFGLNVIDVILQDTPCFGKERRFLAASPILVRETDKKRAKFLYFNSPHVDKALTNSLKNKLKLANLPEEGATVKFDRAYHQAKVKASTYKGITSKGSLCPVIISGTEGQVAFAWCVGVGNSTGIGFGALV